MRAKVEQYRHKIFPAFVAIIIGIIALGCSQNHLTGVVQRSTAVEAGWELALGPSDAADYILVEHAVLMDREGRTLIAKDPRNRRLLGSKYVGMRIRVNGGIERDGTGRKFIRVTRRDQIEIR
jgi:hypothetical protein